MNRHADRSSAHSTTDQVCWRSLHRQPRSTPSAIEYSKWRAEHRSLSNHYNNCLSDNSHRSRSSARQIQFSLKIAFEAEYLHLRVDIVQRADDQSVINEGDAPRSEVHRIGTLRDHGFPLRALGLSRGRSGQRSGRVGESGRRGRVACKAADRFAGSRLEAA